MKTSRISSGRYTVIEMIETKDLTRLVAIFVVAVVVLAAALIIFDREITLFDVVVIAASIAILAILAIRVVGFIMAVRDLR